VPARAANCQYKIKERSRGLTPFCGCLARCSLQFEGSLIFGQTVVAGSGVRGEGANRITLSRLLAGRTFLGCSQLTEGINFLCAKEKTNYSQKPKHRRSQSDSTPNYVQRAVGESSPARFNGEIISAKLKSCPSHVGLKRPHETVSSHRDFGNRQNFCGGD
jgi:hypothetical protein